MDEISGSLLGLLWHHLGGGREWIRSLHYSLARMEITAYPSVLFTWIRIFFPVVLDWSRMVNIQNCFVLLCCLLLCPFAKRVVFIDYLLILPPFVGISGLSACLPPNLVYMREKENTGSSPQPRMLCIFFSIFQNLLLFILYLMPRVFRCT